MNKNYLPKNQQEFIKGCLEFKKHEKRDSMYKVATFLLSEYREDSDKINLADGLGVLLLTWNQAFYRYGLFNFEKLEKCLSNNSQRIKKFRKREIFNLSENDEKDIKNLFKKFLESLQIDILKFSNENTKKYSKEDLINLLNELNIKLKNDCDLRSIYNSIKSKIKGIEFIDSSKSDSNKDYIVIYISKIRSSRVKILKSLRLIKRSPVAVAKTLHLLAPKFFPIWDNKIAKGYGCNYSKNPEENYLSFCKKIKQVAEIVKNFKLKDPIKTKNESIVKLIDEYNYSKYTKGWLA